ncbi:carbohydrate-binding protein [Ochrobactrum phage vB_OspM_OC]|nr:carbohydrate-binding protein [Ochrobactrum phage vB_OspM_OC]
MKPLHLIFLIQDFFMAKKRITELPKSSIVVGTDETLVIQNGKTYKATISQLALAPISVTVDNIVGLQDALDEKVDIEDFDLKANVIHTHVSTDITDASNVGRSILTATNSHAATIQLDAFSASDKGLVPAPGNTSFNVTLTNNGWRPHDIATGAGIKFEENTVSRKVSLDINGMTATANISNFQNVYVAVYDELSTEHLKITLDTFARKTHVHAIADVTGLTTALDTFVTKNGNLSDIQNGQQAVLNLGATNIGNTLFFAANVETAQTAVGLKSGDTNINVQSLNNWSIGSWRSPIVNGALNIWQRGSTFTGIGFNADGWKTRVDSGSPTGVLNTTRESFAPGQIQVADNPRYYIRLRGENFASADLALETGFEDVTIFQGQQVTLSFWARSSTDRDIRLKVIQNFGTGGTVSAEVTTTVLNQFTLNSAWQRVTATFTMPTIAGKILGTNDATDHIRIQVVLKDGTIGSDIGTSYADFALFMLEAGNKATKYEYKPRDYEDTICKRYYQKLTQNATYFATAGSQVLAFTNSFIVPMRVTPTATKVNTANTNVSTTTVTPLNEKNFKYAVVSSTDGNINAESVTEFSADILV